MTVGHRSRSTPPSLEARTITSVGPRSRGRHRSRQRVTGVTRASRPLDRSRHPVAARRRTCGTRHHAGTGVTFTTPLTRPTLSERVRPRHRRSRWRLRWRRPTRSGSTINGPTTGLISDSPQGQIVGVLNNDQDGLNYPARKWGTGHYLNDLVNGGRCRGSTTSTPRRSRRRRTASTARSGSSGCSTTCRRCRRSARPSANAVTQAMQDLGQKYNFSIPLENPLMFKNTGSTPDNPAPQTVPSYLPEDQAKYTPVLDDRTGRTDQVSFGIRGIPSLGDIGQYDSSTNPLVGGNENPYPADYPEQADDLRRVRAGLHERLLLEPELLGVRHRARAGRLRQAVRGPAAGRRVHRDLLLVRGRLAAEAARCRSRTVRSRTSR